MGQTHNSCGFRQVYSLHLNIIGRDLAANRPDPVRILDVGTYTILTEQTLQMGLWYGFENYKARCYGDAYLLQCTQGLLQYNFVLPILQ